MIVTSDHGESLDEHDIFFDHHGLYDVTTHVPLILHGPKFLPPAGPVEALVQHVDLVPTLCDLLGIDRTNLEFDGSSWMPLFEGRTTSLRDFILSEENYVQRKIAIRTRDHKYIFAPDGKGFCNYCQKIHKGPEELYDLTSDPGETVNRIAADPEIAAELRNRLKARLAELDARRDRLMESSGRQDPPSLNSEEERERESVSRKLKSLGYME
jgi:arylsulfatase A-like enzyme